MVFKMNLLLMLWTLVFNSSYASSSLLSYFGRSARDNYYVKVRSNVKLRSIHVAHEALVNSLTQCENECERFFFNCVSFSYNDNYRDRFRNNCFLSRRGTKGLGILSALDFEDDDDFDYYEKDTRFTFGRTTFGSSTFGRFSSERGTNLDNCFRMTRSRDTRTPQNYVRRSLKRVAREDCERSCLIESSFTCKGFYFKSSVGSGYFFREDNCHLTSFEHHADRSAFYENQDFYFYERMGYRGDCKGNSIYGREEDDYRDHFGYDDKNDCFRLEMEGYRFDLTAVRERVTARHLGECQSQCQRARGFECRSLAFRYSFRGLIFNGENCHLSDEDTRSRGTRYNLVPDPNYDLYIKDGSSYDGRCDRDRDRDDFGGGDHHYGGEGGGYETVKGVQCLRQCRQHRIGQYFFCEVDNQINYWDYCCRPGSVCSYDYQVQFNRCEVGSRSSTQWRPCYDPVRGFQRAFLQEATNSSSSQPKFGNATNKSTKKAIELVNLNDII